MVGISGTKSRTVEFIHDDDGNEVIVLGGWENWQKYYTKYREVTFRDGIDNTIVYGLRPEEQWQWKQNYPELVVHDMVEFGVPEDIAHADLMYRGVNKWLFVRYLLVRYKKLVAEKRTMAYDKMKYWEKALKFSRYMYKRYGYTEIRVAEQISNAYNYAYWRGYYDAMKSVREDLKVMATMPRYVIWNGSRPGAIIDKRIGARHKELIKELWDIRFRR